jgi:hypothetical protein
MLSGASTVAANGPTGKGGMALTLRLTLNELLLPDLRDIQVARNSVDR